MHVRRPSGADLNEAALLILGDRKLGRRMGQAGRDHAKRNFCHEEIVARYIELYEKTIARS